MYYVLNNCFIIIFSDDTAFSPEGLRQLLLNTMDIELNGLRGQVGRVPLSHPIHISELFTPNAKRPTNLTVDYSVHGLAKLLIFNAFAQTQSNNVTDFTIREAMKYPYLIKDDLKVSKTCFVLRNIV